MTHLPKVAVHMAVHNRAGYTISCIQKLLKSAEGRWSLELFVADSGSDGIGLRISETLMYKPYTYIKVPENSYWAESMYSCFLATFVSDFDYIFLLNNDVFLYENAIEILSACANRNSECIIIGQLWDPTEDLHAYGGLMKAGIHPLHYESVYGENIDTEVDSIHGNCVLMPKKTFMNGLYLNPKYRHNYADLDLGFRAKKLGIGLIVAPGYVGECTIGQRKPANNFLGRWNDFRSPLGTPIQSQILILKETSSKWLWWVWLIPPIIRLITGRPPKFNSK